MADEDKIIELTPEKAEEVKRRNTPKTIDEYTDDELHQEGFLAKFSQSAEMMNSLELSKKEFPDPEWISEGIIPEGYSLLAGKPKTGKSFFTLQLASSVSEGVPFLNQFRGKKRGVLYISLEESARSIRRRFDSVGGLPSENLNFVFDSAGARPNVNSLPSYLEDFPETGLVIIDTQVLFLPQFDWNDQSESTEAGRILKRISEQKKVSILSIVHTRKSGAEDFIDKVSGSTSLTGAPDSIIVLSRRRGSRMGYIEGTGRDVLEYEHAIRLNDDAGWEYLGTGAEVRRSEEQQTLLEALKEAGDTVGPKDLQAMTDINYGTVRSMCYRLARDGIIKRVGYGKYAAY